MSEPAAIAQQFLSLGDTQQKVIAFQVLSGYAWSDDFVNDKVNLNAISDEQHYSYSALSALYRGLKKLDLTTVYGNTLSPEADYHIAMFVGSGKWCHLDVILPTLLGKFDLSLANYRKQAPVAPCTTLKLGVFLNAPAAFAYDKRRSPIRYNDDIKIIQDFLYEPPLDITWLQTRTPIIQAYICCAKLVFMFADEDKRAIDHGKIRGIYRALPFAELQHDYLYYLMIQIDVAYGDIGAATAKLALLADKESSYAISSHALLAFFEGDYQQSQQRLETGLPFIKKHYSKRNFCFHDVAGLFYFFQKIQVADAPDVATFEMNFYEKHGEPLGFDLESKIILLRLMATLKGGDKDDVEMALKSRYGSKPTNPLERTLYELLQYAVNTRLSPKRLEELTKLLNNYKTYGFMLGAHVFAEIVLAAKPKHTVAQKILAESPITLRFLDLLQPKDPWEYNMLKLESMLLEQSPNTVQKMNVHVSGKRLVWLLDPDKLTLDVLEQSGRKDGTWTAGRAIALSKLYELPEHYTYLTKQDKAALSGIRQDYGSGGWYRQRDAYYFDKNTTILHLIGHPALYHLHHREMRIELEHAEPYVCINQQKSMYQVQLSHQLSEPGVIVEAIGINHYRVIDFSDAYVGIQNVISQKGMKFPASAKTRVLNLLQNAKPDIKIQADMEDTNLPTIEANSAPCLQIFPEGEAINVKLWVRPFTDEGPYSRPGEGTPAVIAAFKAGDTHVRKKAVRDFAAETATYKTLMAVSPTLANYEDGDFAFHIDDKNDILELLAELSAYKEDHPLTLEWPQGETYKVKKQVTAKDLALTIKSGQSWFEYDGEITVDDDNVLEMRMILDSLGKTSSRFVRLDDGGFIALSHQLKKQLQTLNTLSNDQKLTTLGASILDDLAQSAAEVNADNAWRAHLKKLAKMRKHTPAIPTTLQAELRDYQEEGFQYLSRLVNWGIGACLADDMGLGKTIQAIAILLEQASKGPALVIAPKSVSFNWVSELTKFSPTLNVHTLQTADRKKMVKKLGPMDVLISSYGLLQHNDTLLADKAWQTIILDEAQAIKNHTTKRWQAVTKIAAKNRIALTGTPIENHLGEIWSIFHFLNPGLLGSQKQFEQRFALPVEVHRDQGVKHALKTLISPFILRRLKSDVLEELPPKTEQTIVIEPSPDETAFYEALRSQAMDNIQAGDDKNKRFKILAEINRLRQACCHPGLVQKDIDIESSKLQYFKELILSLKENNHKALVFSQYVRYLDLVRPVIDDLGLHYHYLDGSTSLAKRKAAVEAFQSGDGDLFLLSLKAGGSGLNLTAADYVIHLDPWWNPAVEDQASDRAHRIGQERPVTIYRLVMQNTIEEKMIAMHKDKRDLATELLSGQGEVGKLSEVDLINLIAT